MLIFQHCYGNMSIRFAHSLLLDSITLYYPNIVIYLAFISAHKGKIADDSWEIKRLH